MKHFPTIGPYQIYLFLSKYCEKVVVLQFNQYLHDNCLHEVYQSAYKPCHSTESALIRVQNDIRIEIDNDNCVMLLFLDLSAVFDTVSHQVLLSKLSDRFGMFCHGLSVIFRGVSSLYALTTQDLPVVT